MTCAANSIPQINKTQQVNKNPNVYLLTLFLKGHLLNSPYTHGVSQYPSVKERTLNVTVRLPV